MKDNLLAVSHDAGGAEVLSSYLRHKRRKYDLLRCVVKGPAKRIFLSKGLGRCLVGAEKGKRLIINRQVNLLLVSTSRSTNLELDFIALAKEYSVKRIAILEHWINYKERFGSPSRHWRENLPEEIWVLDPLARKLARKEFGEAVKIKIKTNFYFKDLKREYSRIPVRKDNRYLNVLFLSEPIIDNRNLNKEIKITEIEKLTKLIDFMKTVDWDRPVRFTIRQHPIERLSEYSAVLRYNSDSDGFKVALSNSNRNSLVKDIRNADLVMGMRSSALITAAHFKNTICCCDQPQLWFSAYNIKQAGSGLKGLKEIFPNRDGNFVKKEQS